MAMITISACTSKGLTSEKPTLVPSPQPSNSVSLQPDITSTASELTASTPAIQATDAAVRPAPTNQPVSPTKQLAISDISSPLKDVTVAELPSILSNPFVQPLPGRDDGHHGADFSFYRWKDRIGMTGLPVTSVFDGVVSSVISGSLPYGNFIIIETKLELVPVLLNNQSVMPAALPTILPDARLTCPQETLERDFDFSMKSLYLLYAHLDSIECLEIGDSIGSGEKIGTVGNTGLSSNPHLHLEARIGPSGAAFDKMSHYRADATNEEMANYCLWRATNTFQLIDPMVLFLN